MSKALYLNDEECTQALLLADELIQQAQNDRSVFLERIEQSNALFDDYQERDNKPWTDATEAHLPLCKTARNALLARFRRALFGQSPLWPMRSYRAADALAARQWAAVLHTLAMDKMRITTLLDPVLQAGPEVGSGIAYVRWQTTPATVKQWVEVDPDTEQLLIPRPGQGETELRDVKTFSYDYPMIDYIPIERAGTFPASEGNVQNAHGVYIKTSVTAYDITIGQRLGYYDEDAAKKVLEWTGDTEFANDPERVNKGIESTTQTSTTEYARRYDITEVYQYCEGDDGLPEDWLFTFHIPSLTTLQARPNPWAHGQRPLEAFRPYPAKTGFIGDSVADLAGQMQDSMTRILRASVDSAESQVNPEMLIDAGIDGQQLDILRDRRGPGGLVPIPNLQDFLEKYKPFPSTYQAQSAIPFEEFLYKFFQIGSGVSATMTGQRQPAGTTAYEIEQMLGEGQEVAAMCVDRLGDSMARIGWLIGSLVVEHQDRQSIRELWELVTEDSNASGDRLTYEEFMDAWPRLSITSAASMSSLARTRDTMNLQTLVGLLSNPQSPLSQFTVMSPDRLWNLVNDLAGKLGITNPERYIGDAAPPAPQGGMDGGLVSGAGAPGASAAGGIPGMAVSPGALASGGGGVGEGAGAFQPAPMAGSAVPMGAG